MNTNKLKRNLHTVLIACAIGLALLAGNLVGRWQSKEWSATKVHHEQQLAGYSYCPYCGEKLER